MTDAEIRRLERARDLEPCRATIEALDVARARRGDGPWLPQPEALASWTLDEFAQAWIVEADLPWWRVLLVDVETGAYVLPDIQNVLPVPAAVPYAVSLGVMRSAGAGGTLTLSFGDQRTSLDIVSTFVADGYRVGATHVLSPESLFGPDA